MSVCRACCRLKLKSGVHSNLLSKLTEADVGSAWPGHEFMVFVQGLVEVKADKQRAEQLAEQAAEKWSALPPSPEPAPRTPKQVRQRQNLSAVIALMMCPQAASSCVGCWLQEQLRSQNLFLRMILHKLLEDCSTICNHVQEDFVLSCLAAGAACRKLLL